MNTRHQDPEGLRAPTTPAHPRSSRRPRRAALERVMLALAVLAASVTFGGTAHADDYPTRPVTIVVPYPPGGSNDVFARRIGKGLADALGQPVVIDNKPGASGNIGTSMVAKAAPDGYTLVAVSSSMTTNAALGKPMPYDPVKDLTAVAMMAKGPFIVAVSNDFAAKDPASLIALLKANPDKFNYASSGTGSSNQFATEMLKAASATSVVHVPYRGMGPAVTDLAGNQVQMLIASGPSLMPQVRAGKIRAIGITSPGPSPIAPDLVPMSSVAPGYSFELWWGLLAPAGLPQAIRDRLNAAVNKVLADEDLKAFLIREGAEPTPISADAFATAVREDIARFREVAQRQNIKAE